MFRCYRIWIFSLLLLMSFTIIPPKRITIWLVGDSTMSNKEVKAYPETGWGMPFSYFFDSTIAVDNRAQNGRSTRTFIEEGRWKAVVDDLHEGDYVLIQFGHNDEVPTKKSYTTEEAFQANLAKFVIEARDKKAIPVLMTPVARRKFDAAGHVEETHAIYTQLVKNVAAKYQVPLIDLNQKSQQLLQQLGPESSKYLYNYLLPGENPNYPKGKEDNTHFNELGARKMAEIVLREIKNLHLDVANHIRGFSQKER